ncbi:FG-GAP-like repeat-containing protein [Chitinophaga filiformis]|uniref:Por secretion system C-terminal sorting domain-containing protein n=1 Tax=Chitinophaga filiformis TaxID=104663 RepID=A0A1G8BT22_CHIFI|nr:FG-GAP-like repeat-containing protein [Chitinophaga filiformis]SDH36375.1 Por secretion system C-terminal sorting domain-containing protein [Chitinophaga filiformis]
MQHPYLKKAFKGFLSFITIYIFSLSPALAQMRQMYLDADEDNDIKKVSFYSPNEGYVAFTNWIGYTTDSGRTYTKKIITTNNVSYGNYTNINITFGFGIGGVKAFDKNTLIVYGDYGLVPSILYSVDGGNSFRLVFHSQYDPFQLRTGIKDIVFPQNDNIGYAVDADRILKTTDKGMNWSVQTVGPGTYFDHLEAVDNNNVIAISTDYKANRLLKTIDGGASWLRITLPQTGVLTYAYFLDANVGWLSMYSGEYRYFYKTTNGGQQWTLQNDVDATPFNCDKMRFTDVNTGYALVAPYKVYKTTNSGVTWEPISRENNFTYLGYSHYDLQCLSASQLWAGGGHGFLEMTTNGGGSLIPAAYFKTDTSGMYKAGDVQLLNYSKTGYQYQWLVNGSLISTSYNTSYTHDISRSVDTLQLIVSAGGISDTLTRYPQFYAGGLAKATSYYPKSGSEGTFVTIFGSKFSNVSGVSFGGTPAVSFTVLSDTVITAVVAGGATGTITLKQLYGRIPVGEFTYNPPPVSLPPIIQSVSPSAGIIGTTVTITGSGFSANASQNSVFFGTVPAKLQSVSPGQIICTVPVGASLGTIQVLNKDNGLLGESPSPFSVPFTDSTENFTPNSFTEGLILNKGAGIPSDLQGKDIDGDGKPDLVVHVGAGQGDSLAVYRNTTTGGRLSFARRVNVGYIYFPTFGGFALNDLDGDGRPDVVMPTNEKFIKVYRNASSPGLVSFEKEYLVPAGRGTQKAVITDLDNDGKNDIAVTSFEEYRICVMRNTSVPGSLSFGATQNYDAAAETVAGIAAGDLDGDGLKDIIACPMDVTPGSILLFHNTSTRGNISFASFVRISVPGISFAASFISIVDFDMDGISDIVICNDDNICVLRNIGSFSFLPPVVMPLQDALGNGGCVSNFSGSVRPDIIAAAVGRSREIIMEKNISLPGTPKLDSLVYGPGDNSTHIFAQAVAAADFDGDGKPDFAASSLYDAQSVIVYKNTVNVPVITPMCTSRQGGSTLVSDISGGTYKWQQDTGSGFTNVVSSANLSGETTNTLQFDSTPVSWNGYKYRCIVDGRYSSTFVLQLNYTPSPGLIVTATDTTFCLGRRVTFVATDTIGSAGYNHYFRWQWQINGVNTGYFLDDTRSFDTLQDLDQVRVIAMYSDICGHEYSDTSSTITVHVNGDTASVQISVSDLEACLGTPITFTATPRNPGSLPVYDWRVNNISQGVDSVTFTSSRLRKNDYVQVLMKSAATCAYPNPARSNILTLALKDTSAPSVSIWTATPTACNGANVSFLAIPENAGPVNNYQWMVNGIATGTNAKTFSSSTLRDKDIVQCVLTSPSVCRRQPQASSGIIRMTISTPDIRVSGDTVVIGGLKSHLTATTNYWSTDLQYQWQDSTRLHSWQDISGAVGAALNYVLAKSGDKIRCIGKTDAGCMAISNTIALRINVPTATPEAPSVSADYRWYPNPVSSTLYVQDENRLDQVSTITVFNSLGISVLVMNNTGRQEKININVSTLPGGVYFVEMRRRSGKTRYFQFMKVQ